MASDRIELPDGQEQFKLNEVCKLANVQPYMLRFWGSEFPELEAARSGTGQRSYTREQVELIFEIRHLLFDEGLTIAGTRKRITADATGEDVPKKGRRRKKTAKAVDKTVAAAEIATAAEDPVEVPPESSEERVAEIEATAAAGAMPESSGLSQEEVDKIASERVKPLLATLKELRSEISELLGELRSQPE